MGAARRGGASISKEHVMSQVETSATSSTSIPASLPVELDDSELSQVVGGSGPVGGWGCERISTGPVGGW